MCIRDSVRSRSKAKPTIGPLVDGSDTTVLQPEEQAERLNQYFASVFTEEDKTNVPNAQTLFRGNESDKLLNITIEEEQVQKKLRSLRIDKAAGADDMTPRILAELADVISFPITCIMNDSIISGVVPDEWKSANVTPIHKSGSKGRVENYRPISLTSQICKLQNQS